MGRLEERHGEQLQPIGERREGFPAYVPRHALHLIVTFQFVVAENADLPHGGDETRSLVPTARDADTMVRCVVSSSSPPTRVEPT